MAMLNLSLLLLQCTNEISLGLETAWTSLRVHCLMGESPKIDFILEGLNSINVTSQAHLTQMGFAHCALAAKRETRILK